MSNQVMRVETGVLTRKLADGQLGVARIICNGQARFVNIRLEQGREDFTYYGTERGQFGVQTLNVLPDIGSAVVVATDSRDCEKVLNWAPQPAGAGRRNSTKGVVFDDLQRRRAGTSGRRLPPPCHRLPHVTAQVR